MPAKRGFVTRVLGALGLQRVTRSYYSGAAAGRLHADWILGPSSANDEVKSDAVILRQRARDLRRNNGIGARYVKLQVHGILGPSGVSLRAVVPNTRGQVNESASTAIETAWRQWGAAATCDVRGLMAWPEIERLVVETWKTDGEALVQLVPGFSNGWGFAVQVLDPDVLDDTYTIAESATTNAVTMGVEHDRTGRPVAYHILERHPSELAAPVRRRVPADQIIHVFTPTRVGQSRGVTPFAPVMRSLKMLGGMQEALLVLMRTAACKMGFWIPNERYDGPLPPANGDVNRRMDAEPGLIDQGPPGYDFQPWDPGQPGDNAAAFILESKRDIAAGFDVSHAALTGNLAEANYGSQRVGMTLEREGYKRDTAYLARTLHDRVFATWLSWAILSGKLQISASIAQLGAEVAEWQARAFDWIDPAKDIDAALAEVDAGLNSLTRIAASKGRDINDVLAERAAEQEKAASLGVSLVLHKQTGNSAQPDAAPTTPAAPVRLLREAL
jgi:lambda family phage portal protein